MPTSKSIHSDRLNLSDKVDEIILAPNPDARFKPDNIIQHKVTKLDESHAEQIRKELDLTGVIVIGFEDILKSPDKIKIVKSGDNKLSNKKLISVMAKILNARVLKG